MKKIAVVLFVLWVPLAVHAQPAPSFYPGCVFVSSLPTMSNLQTTPWHCDINGKLITTGGSAAGLTINTSIISGGTSTRLLFDNAGTVGETSGAVYTAATGLISGTSLTLGGAILGSTALAVQGSATISGQALFTDGSASSPPIALETNTGFYLGGGVGSHEVTMTLNGITALDFSNPSSPNVVMKSTSLFGWASGAPTTAIDTMLSRGGAPATLQFGGADAASPAAQTLQFQNGSGTNVNAVNATIIASLGTGTGTSGQLILQAGTPTISGTTKQTATTAITISGTAVTFGVTPVFATSTTGAGTQTFTNSPCSNTTTATWIRVNVTGIVGPGGNVFIPACH